MEHLTIALDWFANTNHTGFLLAQQMGWFEDAGLDVHIHGDVHGHMDPTGTDLICGPQIAMLECRERNIPLTAVATLTQKCDSGIVSLKQAGITSPRMLEGKRLTHWSAPWFHTAIRRVVQADGGNYDRIQLVNLDVGDITAVLGTEADATWVYENWENQVLLEAGQEINYFNLGDIDPIFDFCAPAMAATEEALEKKPHAIETLLDVLDQAYRTVAREPAKSVLAVRSLLPADVSDSLLIRSQEHLAPILLDHQGRWGRIDSRRWEPMAQFLLDEGVISRRWDREYTNDYFPHEH